MKIGITPLPLGSTSLPTKSSLRSTRFVDGGREKSRATPTNSAPVHIPLQGYVPYQTKHHRIDSWQEDCLARVRKRPQLSERQKRVDWHGRFSLRSLQKGARRRSVSPTRAWNLKIECHGSCSNAWGMLVNGNLPKLITIGKNQPDVFA
jgi:hypothetical protein